MFSDFPRGGGPKYATADASSIQLEARLDIDLSSHSSVHIQIAFDLGADYMHEPG